MIFPTSCALCGEPLNEAGWTDVCSECWLALEPWTGPACARCGVPFSSERALDAAQPLCGPCRRGEFQLDGARSFGLYRDMLGAAIRHMKFRPRERWGRRLGSLLAGTWALNREVLEAELPWVVPVPLHVRRRRERGFNQAQALAEGLISALGGVRSGLRVENRCLKKIRATPPQTGLSLSERRENVRGAFAVDRPERLRGRAVVLVDDVMTTGATLAACALELKGAGCSRVVALTLARATPQFPDVPVDEPARE